MRKILICAAAASVLAVAAPASAQYYPQPQGYGYGWGQSYNFRGHARALQVRVDRIQREINRLAQFRMISRSEWVNRQQDARAIERRLRRDARDGRGLNAREMYETERRIARLEWRIARDVRDGRRWAYRW
jgi:hypothetical protein